MVSFHSNPKYGEWWRMFQLLNNCTYFTCYKVMLKIQARLLSYINWKIPDIQAGFWRGSGGRNQITNICWIMEKQGSSRKTSTSASLIMLKSLTLWSSTNCGKFLKRWKYQTTLPVSWETGQEAKLELDMEQWIYSKLRKINYLISLSFVVIIKICINMFC